MAATLKQIAAASGVSAQTVSRILRQQGHLHSEQTRRRVLEIARMHDYRPNPISCALLGARTRTIGVIARGFGGRLALVRMSRFTQIARDRGYFVYLVNLDRADNDDERVIRAARDLADRRVEGLLINRSMPCGPEARRFLASLDIPVVYLGWGPPRCPNRVSFDPEGAISDLARHLYALGHREAVLFPSQHACDFPGQRVLPFERAFAKVGLTMTIAPAPPPEPDLMPEEVGYGVVFQTVRAGTNATALLMYNDEQAVGALAALREAGLSVPGDVSVTGFDDLPVAAFTRPALTTVRAPRAEAGEAAFGMLERLIADRRHAVSPRVFRMELVVRGSTGHAPTRRLVHLDAVSPAIPGQEK